MSARLTDKVAIVTGSSSGIGRAISLRYAAEGAIVVCADLDPACPQGEDEKEDHNNNATSSSSSKPTHDLITLTGGRATFTATDVRESSSVSALIASTVAAHGRLDIMVNNAGIGVTNPRPIWALPPEAWDRMQAVNARGVFLGIKYAAAQMLRQEPLPGAGASRGWIINAASVLGLKAQSLSAEYCAAKALVVNLTRAVALDCAPVGIHVNAFAPGYADTGMTHGIIGQGGEVAGRLEAWHPLKGTGRAEDLGGVCVFLASEDAGWMTGVTIPVDGGFMAGNAFPELGVFTH